MNKYFKFFVTALIILILLFTTCLNIFAYTDSFSFYLDTLPNSHIAVGTFSCTRVTHVSRSCSYVKTTSYDSVGFVVFEFPGTSFVSGQTYTVSASFCRLSGSNGYVRFGSSNRGNVNESGNEFIQFTLSNVTAANNTWSSYSFSFVADGSSVYRLVIQPTSLSTSTNNFDLWVSDFNFYRFNPNAALESAVDEQNSLIDEQNTILDEQNSLIDDQNSLIDEQNSQLFDGSESFTGYEDSLDLEDSILDTIGIYAEDLFSLAGDIASSEKLEKGVLSITYFFNQFWLYLSIEEFRWVRLLVYLSVTCSIFLLILHSGIIGGGSSKSGGKKGD